MKEESWWAKTEVTENAWDSGGPIDERFSEGKHGFASLVLGPEKR
jgi:hypothetical protein